MEDELRAKSARLAELDVELNLEKRGSAEQPAAMQVKDIREQPVA